MIPKSAIKLLVGKKDIAKYIFQMYFVMSFFEDLTLSFASGKNCPWNSGNRKAEKTACSAESY